VVDADVAFGDLTWALGVPRDSEARTLADLEPVRHEIREEHVRNVLWSHASGARALLAPPDGSSRANFRPIVEAAAGLADSVVVHLPRAVDANVREVFEIAARVLVVVSLDVIAFRDAKRALETIEDGVRWDIVVNRAGRGLIVPADVERVFGRPAVAVLPFDRRVAAAQDRGELVPARCRAGRAIDRLARKVLEEAA
jgi:Flp pilus assembly CpaE family ATPase